MTPEPQAPPATPEKRTRTLSPRSIRIAWIVAIVADTVQWGALPLFMPGAASPFDAVLEGVVSLVLFRLLGWHPVLLPALLAELIPGMSLVPTWVLAVFIATRGRGRPPQDS